MFLKVLNIYSKKYLIALLDFGNQAIRLRIQ